MYLIFLKQLWVIIIIWRLIAILLCQNLALLGQTRRIRQVPALCRIDVHVKEITGRGQAARDGYTTAQKLQRGRQGTYTVQVIVGYGDFTAVALNSGNCLLVGPLHFNVYLLRKGLFEQSTHLNRTVYIMTVNF